MRKLRLFVVLGLVFVFFGSSLMAFAQGGTVTFLSTQFNRVEEAERAIAIFADSGADVEFIPSEEAPAIDLLRAESNTGEGTVDILGALHGTFPILASEDLLFDLTDVLNTIEAEYDIADPYVELGKLGTEDYQYYIPWMQATYLMAASNEALEYLPEGADINALTYDQLLEWARAITEATGEQRLGFPVGESSLIHRFMQGHAYPSFTGTMVTGYQSEEAVAMFEYLRELWQYVNPQSITYDNMNVPLLSGEVWIAWDHMARLKPAFDERPDDFVTFPVPAGPAGRAFMPVLVGLAIPYTAPNPDAAAEFLRFMLSPETQARVAADLGFFPVISGVDMSAMPQSVAMEAAAIEAQVTSAEALPALLPIGLADRGGEFNQIYKDTLLRIVQDGEDIPTVLAEEAANIQAILDATGAPCWPPDVITEGACQIE